MVVVPKVMVDVMVVKMLVVAMVVITVVMDATLGVHITWLTSKVVLLLSISI